MQLNAPLWDCVHAEVRKGLQGLSVWYHSVAIPALLCMSMAYQKVHQRRKRRHGRGRSTRLGLTLTRTSYWDRAGGEHSIAHCKPRTASTAHKFWTVHMTLHAVHQYAQCTRGAACSNSRP